jgi:hypothetical protein
MEGIGFGWLINTMAEPEPHYDDVFVPGTLVAWE